MKADLQQDNTSAFFPPPLFLLAFTVIFKVTVYDKKNLIELNQVVYLLFSTYSRKTVDTARSFCCVGT